MSGFKLDWSFKPIPTTAPTSTTLEKTECAQVDSSSVTQRFSESTDSCIDSCKGTGLTFSTQHSSYDYKIKKKLETSRNFKLLIRH